MSSAEHDVPTPQPSPASAARTFAGGVLMGLANLVPGVSGGTMILAVGLYDRFVGAVADVTRLRLRLPTIRFLAIFGIGLVVSILTCAGPAVWLVTQHRWIAYSLFVGMTLGGVPLLVRVLRPFGVTETIATLMGVAAMAAFVFGLRDTALPHTAVVFGVVGAVAAASMILPGISGSYILLIFGMYDVIVGSVRPSVLLESPGESLGIVIPVGIGVVLGIAGLSNVLKWLLARYERPAHGVLLGLLLGSVLGLWPFQRAVHPELVTREGIGAVEMLLEGHALDEVNLVSGLELDAFQAESLRSRYAGSTRGDLKRLGLELQRYAPTAVEVLVALVLFLGGFFLTRLIAPREEPAEPLEG